MDGSRAELLIKILQQEERNAEIIFSFKIKRRQIEIEPTYSIQNVK